MPQLHPLTAAFFVASLMGLHISCNRPNSDAAESSASNSSSGATGGNSHTGNSDTDGNTFLSDTSQGSLEKFTSHKTAIISDIDDTIKITHENISPTTVKDIILNDGFYGMASLYKAYFNKNRSTNSLYYVTGSPKTAKLYQLGKNFLAAYGFPVNQNFFYNDTGASTEEMKVAKISGILASADPATQYVLIGDSGQYDPQSYDRVAANFPGKILKIFIHDMYLPEDSASHYTFEPSHARWLTAADLSAGLLGLGLVGPDTVRGIITDTLQNFDKNESVIVPKWAGKACADFLKNYKPSEPNYPDIQTSLEQLMQKISNLAYCN